VSRGVSSTTSLRYYAKTEGRTLEMLWVESFKDVLPALERGEAEIASAAVTITEARKERFGFSSSYFPSQLVLVQRGSKVSKDLASLSGSRIGVLAGSTSLEALSGVDVEIVYAENTYELYQAVVDGKTDGAVTATARALLLLQDFEPLDISLHLGEKEEFGFAFVKGSPFRRFPERAHRQDQVFGYLLPPSGNLSGVQSRRDRASGLSLDR